MTQVPPLEVVLENLDRLQQRLDNETIPHNIKVWEDCYNKNLEALHHYNAWDELGTRRQWWNDYKGWHD